MGAFVAFFASLNCCPWVQRVVESACRLSSRRSSVSALLRSHTIGILVKGLSSSFRHHRGAVAESEALTQVKVSLDLPLSVPVRKPAS